MKRIGRIGLSFMMVGFVINSRADVASNLVSDVSFEETPAGSYPNAASSPWFTSEEGSDGSFITTSDKAYAGSQAAEFTFYFDNGALIQNTGFQIEAGKEYKFSMWMQIAEPSANGAHTNPPTMSMSLFTGASAGGPYSYRKGFFGNLPTATDEWQQITGTWTAADLSAYVGEFVQVRLVKANANTTHRIFIDDVVFGPGLAPLPVTIELIGISEPL